MNIAKKTAILAAVCYHDIFDYCLTRDELCQWCPYLRGKLKSIPSILRRQSIEKVEYITLPRRTELVAVRMEREKEARIKWRIAREAAHKLTFIPTILMVGVSGGLAMNSVRRSDDIDMFVVAKPGTLWITRLIVTLLFDGLGQRRRPGERNVSDKLCFNMFITSDALAMPAETRNLYMAHEVAQMAPVWNRLSLYEKFLTANRWVRMYLPNRYKQLMKSAHVTDIAAASALSQTFARWCEKLEPFARRMQLLYMRKRKTREIVTDAVARFHPHDGRVWIKKELQKRLMRYHIALDKVFGPF